MNNQATDNLRLKIRSIDSIPTIPVIVRPLVEMLQLPLEQVDLGKLAQLISYDKSTAVQCIRMANSPLFPRVNAVESVHSAVLSLGLQRVQSLALGFALNQVVPSDKWVLEMSVFWRHSLGCALVSRKIASAIGYPDPEKAYLAGLIHDLGIMVSSLVCHDGLRRSLEMAASEHLPLIQAEEKCLGFSHPLTGKILAEQWNLPKDLMEVIEFHHSSESPEESNPLVHLVRLSDLICRVRDLGYGYYESIAVDLASEPAWEVLARNYPLQEFDTARLLLEVESSMEAISETVDSVFGRRH